ARYKSASCVVKDLGELSARLALGHIFQSRQRSEREQISLGAVAHGRETVAARDLLALDRAIHVSGGLKVSLGPRSEDRRAGVVRLRVVVGSVRVRDGAGRALDLERLAACGDRHDDDQNKGEKQW